MEGGCFTLLQDDLLHPIMGGNKMRKLDALLPAIHAEGYTDVVISLFELEDNRALKDGLILP